MIAVARIPAPRTPEPDPAERWQLVTAIQAGDQAAFARLYELYRDPVYRVVYRRVQNPTVAEDITQDVFERALRHIGSVSWQGKDPGAWLTTVARNLCADYFKSGRFRRTVLVDMWDHDKPDADRRGDPLQVAVHNDDTTALAAALAGLNVEQRAVLALRFGAGLSITETAQAMGKNEGAIKALQYRAVRQVARLLHLQGVTS